MKTTTLTIIIAAVLALNVNLLFGGTEKISAPAANESVSMELLSLAPTTPTEATFEDMPPEINTIIDLAPITPTVADFEDFVDDAPIAFSALAPVTPIEADFE